MSAWQKILQSDALNQGDLLRAIKIPTVEESFPATDANGTVVINVIESDIIVLSQSCDLELDKLPNVVVAQVFSIADFEAKNPGFQKSGKWKDVHRGRVEALHLVCCPEAPEEPKQTLVVDFRQIASLPVGYIRRVADNSGERWRLQPPYLEALSHAFGRFFSRVAVPDTVKI
jgi:hypothetical protein